MDIAFLTFSRETGLLNNNIRHGILNMNKIRSLEIFPHDCVRAYVHKTSIKCHLKSGEDVTIDLDYWGFSSSLFSLCEPIEECSYPFSCDMVIDVHFSEYE